jgi:hypothetical protein
VTVRRRPRAGPRGLIQGGTGVASLTDSIHAFARTVCRSGGGGPALCYILAYWDRSKSAADNIRAIPARLAWEVGGTPGCWGLRPDEAVQAVAEQLAEYDLWRQQGAPREGSVN